MGKRFLKDAIGWGVGLWFIGYVLGIIAFMFVPADKIGWVVSPIGIIITLLVLLKKVGGKDIVYFLKIAIAWTAIAVVFDYIFLVLMFRPADGYYKLDVYFYYTTTFILPLLVGIFKFSNQKTLSGRTETLGMNTLLEKQIKEKAEYKQRILNFIADKSKISNDDIEKLLNVSDSTATRYLSELEKEGKLKRIGEEGRYTYYKRI